MKISEKCTKICLFLLRARALTETSAAHGTNHETFIANKRTCKCRLFYASITRNLALNLAAFTSEQQRFIYCASTPKTTTNRALLYPSATRIRPFTRRAKVFKMSQRTFLTCYTHHVLFMTQSQSRTIGGSVYNDKIFQNITRGGSEFRRFNYRYVQKPEC